MKKLFTLLIVMLTIISCEQSGINETVTPSFTFAEGTNLNPTIGYAGGELTFSFISNCSWTANENEDWINISPNSGNQENQIISISVDENITGEERTSQIIITYGVDSQVIISLTQDANSTFNIDSDGNYIVEAEGCIVSVKVTTNLEYDVIIPDDASSWLSVADTRAVREETLTFTVAENASFDERSATVELKGADGKVLQSISFKQKGEEKVFDTDGEGNYVVEAVGGKVEVKVTTNLEYTVEIPAEAMAWLSVADTRAVIREETLTFIVAKNTLFDERSATVELKGADGEVLQSISFKQKEYGGAIEVDEEYVVDAEGGELEVKLSTDIDFTTSIPEEAKSWISIVETRSMRSESLTFNIAINDDVKERSATINLQNAKGNDVASFVIRQKGGDAVLELKNQYSISNMGGNFEVAVTTNLEYEVEISADATSWLSYVETRALRTDKLIFNATHNEGEAERSGTIKLIGEDNEELQVITVTQRGNIFGFAYTTNDGKPLDPYITEGFGGEFVENIYDAATGCGVLKFAGAVTTIPEQAFGLCENLTRIDIPEGITTIGKEAFMGCTALEELTIPSTLTSLGSEAFKNCSFKATINCENVSFKGAGFTEVIIGDNVTTIGDEAFANCNSLKSVTIGDSVTTIGNSAFAGCYGLTSITIPDSVTKIGDYAFRNCSSLTRVYCKATTPPAGGAGMFYNTSATIYIPEGSLRAYKLSNAWSSYIDYIVEYDYNSTVTISYTTSDGMPVDANAPIVSNNYQNGVGELIYIGKDIIPVCLFRNCGNLTSVTIPDSVTTIGNSAFSGCDSLTSVTIPDSVTTIGYKAFYSCDSLTSVYCEATTPPSLGGSYVFDYNASERLIYVPAASVEAYKSAEYWSYYASSIVGYDFETSEAFVSQIKYTSTTKVTYKSSVFNVAIIYNRWDETTGEGVITFNGELTTIGGAAFCYCDSLTSVTIPDSVTTIGEDAFAFCDSLTSVTIGDSVTTIGDYAFYECKRLKSVYITDIAAWCNISFGSSANISGCCSANPLSNGAYLYLNNDLVTDLTIPDSVTTIGEYAFALCDSLTSVTIPDSVTTIGDYAFYDCDSLASVTIGDSVTTIGNYAFYDCDSLASVYCEATTPPSLGGYGYVFDNNASGRKIYVPAASVEAYKTAYIWSNYAYAIVGYDF